MGAVVKIDHRLVSVAEEGSWQQFCYESHRCMPLQWKCVSGNADISAGIMKHSELLDIKNVEGYSPLHLAALTEQEDILRMLRLAGANPDLRDNDGNTALHLACMTGNEECVSALITPCGIEEISDKFASFKNIVQHIPPINLEIRNYNGERCVHLAAQNGHLNILRILLKFGADINACEGKSGQTLLHIAFAMNNDKVISFILTEHFSSINFIKATYAGHSVYQELKKTQFYKLRKTQTSV